VPTSSDYNTSNTQPKVNFPTPEQVAAYNMELGSKIIMISNSSQGGEPTSVKAASKGNETFVGWLGKIDGINRVFFSLTRDKGLTYTQPVELSPPNSGNASSGNASNLQLAVYDSIVDLAWQSTNLTNGMSSIIGSVSMDDGLTFKTYQINVKGTNARDPILPGNFIIIWRQNEPCGGGGPNGVENLSEVHPITNSTATDGSQGVEGIDGGSGELCMRFGW
jgi:hypothetical protein